MNTLSIVENRTAFREINRLEPEWLYGLRKAGWKSYNDLPSPNRVSHLWRYSNPGDFVIEQPESLFDLLPILPDANPVEMRPINPEHSALGYNTGNRDTFARLTPELENKGVIFKDLFSAARDNSELVERHLGKLVGGDFGKFEAFNLALWNTGLFLYVPENTVVEKPIYLHRHPTGMNTIARLLVVVGKNASVDIVDDYKCHCRNSGAVANSVVELFAGDSSNLRYVNIQRLSNAAHTFITQRTQAGENADIMSGFAAIGSGVSKVNTGTVLDGRGANSRMSGLIVGDGEQHFDLHTMHHHKSGETFSNLDFKVVLKDKAQSAYTGLIRIEKDAENCEAYQVNRNLLLNEGTKAKSIPELEILNNEVQCSHGATMGPIDPEMVYYLQSRQIDRDEAIRMIIGGFMEPTFAGMPKSVEPMMRDIFSAKLEED